MNYKSLSQAIEIQLSTAEIEDFFERNESGHLVYVNAIFLNGRSVLQPLLRDWHCSSFKDFDEAVGAIHSCMNETDAYTQKLAFCHHRALLSLLMRFFGAMYASHQNPESHKELLTPIANELGRLTGFLLGMQDQCGTIDRHIEDLPVLLEECMKYVDQPIEMPPEYAAMMAAKRPSRQDHGEGEG